MKLRPTRKQLVRGTLLLGALAYLGYGVVEPQTSPGHVVFHLGYSLPATRPIFLRFYQWSLREFNGGYLPGSIDQFLISRLWDSSGSSRERQAIIDFQISQTSGRWGEGFSHADDGLKQQIIGDIVHRLDTFTPEQAMNAFLLIESMRRDDLLGKAGLGTRDGNVRTDPLITAKNSFRRWWGDGTAWPANKSQDPLQGTSFVVLPGP